MDLARSALSCCLFPLDEDDQEQQLLLHEKPPTLYPTSFLLSLPGELLVYLLCTIPAPTAASLSLTCRRLWALAEKAGIRPLSQLLTTRDERWEFLYPLQGCQAWRKHILCYECGQFHRRRRPSTTFNCYRDRSYWLRYYVYDTIPFMRVADMMNGHRYGTGFGFPASYLDYNFHHPTIHGPTSRALRVRVVNDMAIVMLDVNDTLGSDYFRSPASMYWSHRALFIRLLGQLDNNCENAALFARCDHCNADVRMEINRRGSCVNRRCTVWIPLGKCERRDAIWERVLTDCFYPHTEQLPGPDGFIWAKHFDDADTSPRYLQEKAPSCTIRFNACWPTVDGKRTPLITRQQRDVGSWNVHV